MRRSRSLSNIPMPLPSKRDSRNKERSKSSVRGRDPSLDGQTPSTYRLLVPNRILQKGSVRTPTTPSYTGSVLKRSGSLNSFGCIPSSSGRSKSPGGPNIHKLANDKKWVAEQFSKIQHFLQTSGIFNPELAGMINPPTINIFVELVSVLFSQLIKTIPINTQNYADVVSQTLKILRYPGSLSLSTLKTINTTHGRPQFVAIISWLIERVDVQSRLDVLMDQHDKETVDTYCLRESLSAYLDSNYRLVNEQGSHYDEEQCDQKLYEDLLRVVQTDFEAAEKLENAFEAFKREAAELDKKIDERGAENLDLLNSNLEKKDVIKEFREKGVNKEQKLELEIQELEITLAKFTKERNIILSAIDKLKNTIAIQAHTSRDKDDMLNKIEEKKRAISRKENKLAQYQLVRDELDRQLTSLVTEVEIIVDNWNISITKTMLTELKTLHLREKGFHSKDFLEEIKDVNKEKARLIEQFSNEIKDIKTQLENVRQEKVRLEKKYESVTADNKILNADIERLKTSIAGLESKIEQVEKNHEVNMKELQSVLGDKVVKLQAEIQDYNERIDKKTEEVDKTAKKGLSFLLEAYNNSMSALKQMDEMRTSMLENIMKERQKSKERLKETMDELVKLQMLESELLDQYQSDDE